MPQTAAPTRDRILGAAVEEFSAHGLAGARVDRIAAAAAANKRAIYEHFGDKEGLFDAALDHVLGALTEQVPIAEDDLPGHAGRLFDYFVAHPQALRMSLWRQLERPSAGTSADATSRYDDKVAALRDRAGAFDPVDLIVLVGGLATAWFNTPQALLAADGRDPRSAARLAEHRAAVVEAARRLAST
ncbi:TetR family transcriptional regulator [Conexibacter sp. CPCC 206217]|uniref:TetR family transcriptional regulator n=1 Tax=Conexibacter sp. CPCC 206217 TaxID=3064574 RepID=UPI0027217E8F|nr:TetR family transcriptional regulator [Conexibacter sp. CPCC 206217]MDO8209741.1 TetR family transcriptional regulator [Conexibacter sp. CPCC 206217]